MRVVENVEGVLDHEWAIDEEDAKARGGVGAECVVLRSTKDPDLRLVVKLILGVAGRSMLEKAAARAGT